LAQDPSTPTITFCERSPRTNALKSLLPRALALRELKKLNQSKQLEENILQIQQKNKINIEKYKYNGEQVQRKPKCDIPRDDKLKLLQSQST
jgi:hypothetical protein